MTSTQNVTERLALKAFEVKKEGLEVMDFHNFRVKLSRQGLPNKVENLEYPGDKFM